MADTSNEIPLKVWLKSLARSFLVQAAFNSERMQNVGFAYGIAPMLGKEVSGEEGGETPKGARLAKHLEFFNTNPYMASAVIGAVGRLEMDGRNDEEVKSFKRGIMGPFGALGDSLFWCSLKPVAVLVGVSLSMGGHYIWAVVATLLIYNALHLWARLWGFYSGVYYGRWMVYRFSRIRFARSNAILGFVAMLILAISTVWGIGGGECLGTLVGGRRLVAGALAGGVVLLCSLVVRRGIGAETLFYLAGGISLAAAIAI